MTSSDTLVARDTRSGQGSGATGWIGPRGAVVASGVLLAIGAVLAYRTSFALLALVVVILSVAVHAKRLGWRLAFAYVLVAGLTGQLLLGCITPKLPVSLATATLLAWTVAGAIHCILLARRGSASISRRQCRSLAVVSSVPLLGAIAYAFWLRIGDNHGIISWALVADNPPNITMSAMTWRQHGIVVGQGNAVPLTTVLNASWAGPRLRGISGGNVADVTAGMMRAAQDVNVGLWLLVSLVIAVLAVRGNGLAGRLGAPLLALLPWTVMYTIEPWVRGWQNGAPTMLMLLLCWFVYREAPSKYAPSAVAMLILGSLGTAAAWTPLAGVSGALLIVTLVGRRRALLGAPRTTLTFPGVAAIVALLYAGFFAYREARAPVNAGTFARGPALTFTPGRAVGVAIAVLLITVVLWRAVRRTAVGLAAILAISIIIELVLVHELTGTGRHWYYYTAKFAWYMTLLLALVVIAELLAVLPARWPRGRTMITTLAIVTALPVALGFTVANNQVVLRDAIPVPTRYQVTPLAIVKSRHWDDSVTRLFAILRGHPKSLVIKFSPGQFGYEDDWFINRWTIYASAPAPFASPTELSFAARMMAPPGMCQVAAAWGPSTTIWSTSAAALKRVKRDCSTVHFHTKLVTPDEVLKMGT